LRLKNNPIHTINDMTSLGLSNMRELTLDNAPLFCDARLAWIKKNWKEDEGSVKLKLTDPPCAGGPTFLTSVALDDLTMKMMSWNEVQGTMINGIYIA